MYVNIHLDNLVDIVSLWHERNQNFFVLQRLKAGQFTFFRKAKVNKVYVELSSTKFSLTLSLPNRKLVNCLFDVLNELDVMLCLYMALLTYSRIFQIFFQLLFLNF
jgi:hypothetical protein